MAGALDALSRNAKHWILISSISVYSNLEQPGEAEDTEVYEPVDLSHYGHAKVAAERASAQALANRLLIARPGLIAGPGNGSDRFSYCVAAMARAGNERILIPDPEARYLQVIDVRDIAAWIVEASSRRLTGTCNVVGTAYPFAQFLRSAAKAVGYSGQMVIADDDWLVQRGVSYWAGPRSLPLWIPIDDIGSRQRSNKKYRETGGGERSLEQLLRDVLEDERARGLDRPRRSGLSRAEECELLSDLDSGRSL